MRLLVLDVDGVMTDGRLYYGATGELGKSFHARDGFGIKALLAAGLGVAVISGRHSPATEQRCLELGIPHVLLGVADKGSALAQLLESLELTSAQCVALGDDAGDLPMLQRAGLAVAVADAHPSALALAHRRTRLPGGAGAVREVCDWLLAAQGAHGAARTRRRP
ncbi:MAG: HAD hydrolase family protein [Steroidobacteraceae bacterium]|jgi:3-deoxy-D-manno-octulosonate 8-phosphate phosphatase (KDO 8-P phosphatase)